MYDFHIRNPYHHEALMVLADFFKMQGKFPESTELVKKTIYSFENSFGFQFKITGDIPFSRLDYDNEDNKLAYILSEALQRYIDILGRKGCTRTALEYSKLLLSFDPEEDKFGVLLKIDYYALRSGEIDYFKRFVKDFSYEFYRQNQNETLYMLPNLIYSTALAKFLSRGEQITKPEELDTQLHKILNMTNPHDIDDLSADGTLMIALMLYPSVISQLSKKNQFEKIGNLSKSYFTKEQKLDWASILKTSLFQDEQDNVAELLEVEPESVQKLFSLYVERSHVLYKGNDVIIWLKEIIGYLIKAIEE